MVSSGCPFSLSALSSGVISGSSSAMSAFSVVSSDVASAVSLPGFSAPTVDDVASPLVFCPSSSASCPLLTRSSGFALSLSASASSRFCLSFRLSSASVSFCPAGCLDFSRLSLSSSPVCSFASSASPASNLSSSFVKECSSSRPLPDVFSLSFCVSSSSRTDFVSISTREGLSRFDFEAPAAGSTWITFTCSLTEYSFSLISCVMDSID